MAGTIEQRPPVARAPCGEERKAKVKGKRAWRGSRSRIVLFHRLRKFLVRHEKTDRSYMTLNMLPAAIIVFRNVGPRQQYLWTL